MYTGYVVWRVCVHRVCGVEGKVCVHRVCGVEG